MSTSESNISVQSTGNLERRFTFRLPSDQLERRVGGRVREMARSARIKGFRPGKVPTKVIEQRYGSQIRAEVLNGLLREEFDQAVRDQELRVAGSPEITPSDDDADGELAYTATFEVLPDFGELDLTQLRVVRPQAEVADEDIDRMIENLRLQRRSWNAVERPAEQGDAVDVATWSQVCDTRLPAEGAEHGVAVIGTGAMYPQLEAALIGMSAGEEKVIEVDFPADYRVVALAGQHAQVHITAEKVNAPVLPEVDEAFIRSFGVRSGEIAQFRSDIRSNLERELKGALMNRLRREVGGQLIAAYGSTEVPARMVEREASAMAMQALDAAQQRDSQAPSLPPDAHVQFMEPARKRVLLALIVGEVARRNQLLLDAARVQETLRLIASTYEEPDQVVELYGNDPQLMAGLRNRVMEEQVIDWIAERAQHQDQTLSFQEAITPQA